MVCLTEPSVLYGTENIMPKKMIARDNDIEMEISSRVWHRLVCTTGGRKEVL